MCTFSRSGRRWPVLILSLEDLPPEDVRVFVENKEWLNSIFSLTVVGTSAKIERWNLENPRETFVSKRNRSPDISSQTIVDSSDPSENSPAFEEAWSYIYEHVQELRTGQDIGSFREKSLLRDLVTRKV